MSYRPARRSVSPRCSRPAPALRAPFPGIHRSTSSSRPYLEPPDLADGLHPVGDPSFTNFSVRPMSQPLLGGVLVLQRRLDEGDRALRRILRRCQDARCHPALCVRGCPGRRKRAELPLCFPLRAAGGVTDQAHDREAPPAGAGSHPPSPPPAPPACAPPP